MKKVLSFLITVAFVSNSALLFAAGNETIRQDSGIRFGTTPTSKSLSSQPVTLNVVQQPAKTISQSELSVSRGVGKNTAPPPLSDKKDKKDNKLSGLAKGAIAAAASIGGVVVGGALGAVVGHAVMTAAMASPGVVIPFILGFGTAGLMIGAGAVIGGVVAAGIAGAMLANK